VTSGVLIGTSKLIKCGSKIRISGPGGGIVIPTFTVSAAQTGANATGMAAALYVLNNALGIGQVATAQGVTPSQSITPTDSNSWVYGSILGIAGTYTPVAGTNTKQDQPGDGLEFLSCRSTGFSTAGTPETIGYTATVNGIGVALAEIEASGVLNEDASSPGGYAALAAQSITSPGFKPPVNSLLVLMVQSNGAAGVVSVTISDTSGLGLTWSQAVGINGAGDGYAGIWTARVP
jgi:hypothetical protein